LALGTRLPSIAAGAVTVVLFGLGWFAGVLGNIAIAFDATALANAAGWLRILLPTDGLWRGVIFGLEPPAVLLLAAGRSAGALAANPFYAAEPPAPAFLAWSVAWVLLVLLGGIALFRRREL
ncbi:MAG: ABC transporter permease, partial [Candidatus Limnocylindrales bacterium]